MDICFRRYDHGRLIPVWDYWRISGFILDFYGASIQTNVIEIARQDLKYYKMAQVRPLDCASINILVVELLMKREDVVDQISACQNAMVEVGADAWYY